MIPLTECKHRYLYKLKSRNLDFGVFNSKDNGFIGIREKFGQRYLFTEYHYDTGPPFGTVHPIEEICHTPLVIPIEEDMIDPVYHTSLWAGRGWLHVPVIRRTLGLNDIPHGGRHGFEDMWADTLERLPDNVYPRLRENKELFNWIESQTKGIKP